MVKKQADPFLAADYLARRLDLLRQTVGAEEIRVTMIVSSLEGIPVFRITHCTTPEAHDVAPRDKGMIRDPEDPESLSKKTWVAHLAEEDSERFKSTTRSELR